MDTDKVLLKKTALFALGICGFLILLVLLINAWTQKRQGTIVLPGGITYLGPTPVPSNPPNLPPKIDANAQWKTIQGTIYPYAFEVPETVNLVSFPDDPYDIRAIEWPGQNPSDNVLIGVEDDVTVALESYIDAWWKQFALTGIQSKESFTNSKGLKGYKITFRTQSGISPFHDVFLARPGIVIHMANKILAPEIFDRIVDSVSWQ